CPKRRSHLLARKKQETAIFDEGFQRPGEPIIDAHVSDQDDGTVAVNRRGRGFGGDDVEHLTERTSGVLVPLVRKDRIYDSPHLIVCRRVRQSSDGECAAV